MSLLGWQYCTVRKYCDGIEASRATIDDDDYPLFYDLHTARCFGDEGLTVRRSERVSKVPPEASHE